MPTPTPKHYRTFNAPRFILKFNKGGEPLLSAFFRRYLPASDLAKAEPLKTDAVLAFLEKKDDAGKDVTHLLNCAYDLGNLDGAFYLRIAAKNANVHPDPESKLIPEHLSLKILNEHPAVFDRAYDRLGLAKTDNFNFYAGSRAVAIADPETLANLFAARLRTLKKTPKIVVRHFVEAEMVNFIFYHESKPRAPLVMDDALAMSPLWHRPTQQDFICYNTKTGHVEIEIGSRGEQVSIRKAFADVCAADAEFFDQPGSTAFLTLDHLLDPAFTLNPSIATLKGLVVKLDQDEAPSFEIKSKDVFATIERNGLRILFSDEPESAAPPEIGMVAENSPNIPQGVEVTAATLSLVIPGARPTLIELKAPNKVAFPRSMHTATIFASLRALKLLKP